MKCFFRNSARTGFVALFLLVGLGLLATAQAQDDETYIMGDVETLPADFPLGVTVSPGAGGTARGVPVIDGICTFQVSRSDGASRDASVFYDISLFEDGQFSELFKGRSLPFTLKRNYRGIIDGTYAITFVAKDDSGTIGKGQITIEVRH